MTKWPLMLWLFAEFIPSGRTARMSDLALGWFVASLAFDAKGRAEAELVAHTWRALN